MYITTTENPRYLTIQIDTGRMQIDAANRQEYDNLMVRVAELVARAAVLDLDIQDTILPWRV